MKAPTPAIGETSLEYPHGYGFCQCGCGKHTTQIGSGVFLKYFSNRHHPDFRGRPAGTSWGELAAETGEQLDAELVERCSLLSERVKRLNERIRRHSLEIEFAISFVDRCWVGDPETKAILLQRLLTSLRGLQPDP